MDIVDRKERRTFRRLNCNLPLRLIDTKRIALRRGVCCDISANGLGVITKRVMVRKAIVDIWVMLQENQQPIYRQGTIVWQKKIAPAQFRIGIKLESILQNNSI
ncbi:MAG: PilZ domain-containing protein [Candidatus Omnitrophica bacterium]|nr:PilZ domain-containing protein [Candidatus Omnitrophota bacterium]